MKSENQTFGERLLRGGGKLISEIEGEFFSYRIVSYKGRKVIVHRFEQQGKWREIVYEVKATHDITNATEEEKEMLRSEIPSEPIPPMQHPGVVMVDGVEEEEKGRIIQMMKEETPQQVSAN
jgi:hypothetical protein